MSLPIVASGCFPNTEVRMQNTGALPPATEVTSPTKAYLYDASVMLFPNGFSIRKDTITGTARRFWLARTDPQYRSWHIPRDSIAAMTYYEPDISFGRGVASFLLGWWGASLTVSSLYCLGCPKCCFGSCPTVYSSDGSKDWLESELFSSSISKLLEENDLDLLSYTGSGAGPYQLRVTNEALETHYINKLTLLAVSHSRGTRVFPGADGRFVTAGRLLPPVVAVNREGEDVTSAVRAPDTLAYRSGIRSLLKLKEGPYTDWLDVTLNVPECASSVTMVVRLRNTLLSTILLYDVVLASQGVEALGWTEKMNTDPQYASRFREVYSAFSGVAVKTLRNGTWAKEKSIRDAGPITWKYAATVIPVRQSGNLTVRLEFVPDNYAIDYIAFDAGTGADDSLSVEEVHPFAVRDNSGSPRDDVLPLIEKDDDSYLVTNPGESYRLSYDLPRNHDGNLTLFISSKGYYTEWIRGGWLKNGSAGYHFNLFETDKTLSQLAQSWQENRDLIERLFFETRIPVREAR